MVVVMVGSCSAPCPPRVRVSVMAMNYENIPGPLCGCFRRRIQLRQAELSGRGSGEEGPYQSVQ